MTPPTAARLIPSLLLAAVSVGGCGAGIAPDVQAEPGFALAPGQTYAWTGPGSVVGDAPLDAAPDLDQMVRTLIDVELEDRGLTRVERDADLGLHWMGILSRDVRLVDLDRIVGYPRRIRGYEWDVAEVYETGTLILDITRQDSGELVWRGTAEAEMHRDDRAYRDRRLREGIAALVAALPMAGGAS